MSNVKLLLMSKLANGQNGQKFRKFFTSLTIVVKGEEDKGLQENTLNVKFKREVNTNGFIRGIVEVQEDKISIPFKWEIKTDEKTGKKKYPTIWIDEIVNYEQRLATSTGTFNLKDESETEPVEF